MKKLITVCFAVLVVSILSANVFAGLMIDLRYADGTQAMSVDPGTTRSIPISVWATVTGANADGSDDGLLSAWFSLATSNSGALSGLTGFNSSFTRAVGFQPPAGDTVGSVYHNPTTGINNYGNLADKATLPSFVATTTTATNLNTPGATASLVPNGVALLLGTFTYDISSIQGNGSASIMAQIPTAAFGLTKKAQWKADGLTGATVSTPYTVGNGVTLSVIVPEPSTFILLGMGALALVFIRRRK